MQPQTKACQWMLLVASLAFPAMLSAGSAQQTPAPAPPSAHEGARLFATSGCTHCHGPAGNGTSQAPSIHEVRRRRTDEEIFKQIKEGGQVMPPFGEALTEDEIRSIVAFLRSEDGWKLLPAQK